MSNATKICSCKGVLIVNKHELDCKHKYAVTLKTDTEYRSRK